MREIKVIANSQNKNEVYMSDAETFGELKAELINKNYQVEDMDIREGKSRITFTDESSPLPSNFMYKGEPTNDLVILITPKNTKINSGMTDYRYDLYDKIRDFGLEGAAYQVYGRNFTQCSDAALQALIDEHLAEVECEEADEHIKDVARTVVAEELDKREAKQEYTAPSVARGLLKIIDFLESVFPHVIAKTSIKNWKASLRNDYNPYSDEDIYDMTH